MKKTYKIGELNALACTFEIIYDVTGPNHYRLYRRWNEIGPYGLVRHRRLIEKYADLFSVTIWINEFIKNHNEDRRPA